MPNHLPKLSTSLRGLGKLGRVDAANPNESVALEQVNTNRPDQDPRVTYAPYPPFSSADEVYVWSYLQPRDPYWRTQVQQGNPRVSSSTRVDFENDFRRIALHVDGIYWHDKETAHDAAIRAALAGRGFRNVVFRTSGLEYTMDNFHQFYQDNVGG